MIPPPENAIAAFPPSVKVGNVTLRPLTLKGVIRLGEAGIDIAKRVPKDKLFTAAWILSEEDDQKRFLRRIRVGLQALAKAVEEALNVAYTTHIPPMDTGKKPKVSFSPSGLGMPIEYAEWLCAEYGWSFEAALAMPVITVYALAAACRQRHGGKHGGPDYVERRYMKEHGLDNGKEEAV